MDDRLTGRFATGAEKVLPANVLVRERFRVERPVGIDSYSTSYLAMDTSTGCTVILKVLHRHSAADAIAVELEESALRKVVAATGSRARPLISSGALEGGARYQVFDTNQGDRADRLFGLGTGAPGLSMEVFAQVIHGFSVAHVAGVAHGQFTAASVWVRPGWKSGEACSVQCTGFGEFYLSAGEGEANLPSESEPSLRDDVRALAVFLRQCVEWSGGGLDEHQRERFAELVESALLPSNDSPVASAVEFCTAWDRIYDHVPGESTERSTISPLSGLAPVKVDRNVTKQGLAPLLRPELPSVLSSSALPDPAAELSVDDEEIRIEEPLVSANASSLHDASDPLALGALSEQGHDKLPDDIDGESSRRLTPLPVLDVRALDVPVLNVPALEAQELKVPTPGGVPRSAFAAFANARPPLDSSPYALIANTGGGGARWRFAMAVSCLLAGGIALFVISSNGSGSSRDSNVESVAKPSVKKRSTVQQALKPITIELPVEPTVEVSAPESSQVVQQAPTLGPDSASPDMARSTKRLVPGESARRWRRRASVKPLRVKKPRNGKQQWKSSRPKARRGSVMASTVAKRKMNKAKPVTLPRKIRTEL